MLTISEYETELIPIDPMSSKLPIYVCTRDMSCGKLHDFFMRNRDRTNLIENKEDIEKSITSVYRHLRYERPLKTLKDSVLSLLEPFQLSYKDFSISISHASADRKPADNLQISGPLLYIKEDCIDPKSIIKLASLYQELPGHLRPMIFFEPSEETISLSSEITNLNDRIVLKPLGQTRGWRVVDTLSLNGDFPEFIENFLSHSYSACEQVNPIPPEEFYRFPPEELIKSLILDILSIKSHDAAGNKFKALPKARKLLSTLNYASDFMKNDRETKYLLSLKAILNLWTAYIDEDYAQGIDNSLAIANFLENDFLQGHCFRLAHLVSGYSELSGHLVAKAVDYFRSAEEHEAYVYSQNNYLLNQLHVGTVNLDAFSELVEFAIRKTPYLDRLATVINNAGTAYLVSGDYVRAATYYQRAGKYSGQIIHHVGIEVNRLITRYLSGEEIPNEEVMILHRRIVRANLPRGFAYHQSYIHWTLAKMAGKKGARAMLAYLAEKQFMPYEKVIDGSESMVDYLANSHLYNKGKGRFSGARGDFIHRTGLFPIVHFHWM